MIRHLLKLVWNRKRAGALLMLEIFFSFLVTAVVATLGLFCWRNYRQPLGFSYRDVWQVAVDSKQWRGGEAPAAAARDTMSRLLRELQSLPRVEAAAGTMVVPFSTSDDVMIDDSGHGPVRMDFNVVSLDFDRVMGLHLVAGRWFGKGDEALAWQPVVVNRNLARAAFGGADPIGRRLGVPDPKGQEPERRVIGVVADYRKNGELAGDGNYLFLPQRQPGGGSGHLFASLLLRVRPGTTAAFEEELTGRLQRIAPGWSFAVTTLAEMRASSFRLRLAPLLTGCVIALFLLAMVGLGLTGVMWQNLLQRTRELGLRRAAGASRAALLRQIVTEQLLLTTLSVGLATALVVQLPISRLAGALPGAVMAAGLASAMAVIYALVILCSLYPSVIASRVPPAEALRFE
ncbi:MAG TPA: ABC transporter permease [Thermoanaerobaculia bacterium]|nr:ABC transporter permease [Thermoanaerobaculia bacterium]